MPRARLRDLGLTVGTLPPGPFNAITDVDGVKVGYSTLIQDTPRIARTGVTAIWPRGPEIWTDYVFAGTFSFNGNGEMTGLLARRAGPSRRADWHYQHLSGRHRPRCDHGHCRARWRLAGLPSASRRRDL